MTDEKADNTFGLEPEKLKALNEFMETVKDVTTDETTCLRFLSARSYDQKAAEKQLREAFQWKAEFGTDTILDQLPPQSDTVKEIVPHLFHGHDKKGRPIYYERTGEINVALLMNLISHEAHLKNHVFGLEYQLRRCEEKTKELGFPVYQTCTVMDLKGLNMAYVKGMSLLEELTELDKAYYPETMGALYVINTPWFFNMIWKIVRLWLDAPTRAKVTVLGSDYQGKLLEAIDAKYLPKEYGGELDQEIPHVDPSKFSAEMNDPDLTEQQVGSGKTFTKQLRCDGPAVFNWFFRTKDNDIKFGVEWKADSAENKSETVVKLDKVQSNIVRVEGGHAVEEAGELTLTWDNSYSFFTGKQLRYFVSTTPTTGSS